jgi:nitrate reductase NapE component
MLISAKSQPELEKRTDEAKPKAKRGNSIILMLIVYCLFPIASNAQCAMCRASLESGGNVKQVEAVNDGIVYLMAFPYIIVGVVGFAIYKMYYKKK